MAAEDDREVLATQLAASVLTSRVGAAAGRPNALEAVDAAAYYRIVLAEIRDGLGLPPRPPADGG
ncbi:MAG: hypothetical protein AB1416_03295 [Actinomycetota bacterium]